MKVAEERGFPGMMGSLNCMLWAWKNFHVAYQGYYMGKDKEQKLILEAVASNNLWILEFLLWPSGGSEQYKCLGSVSHLSEDSRQKCPQNQLLS